MEVHIVTRRIDHTRRNIRAVICYSLKVGKKVCPDKACLNRTSAVLKSKNISTAAFFIF